MGQIVAKKQTWLYKQPVFKPGGSEMAGTKWGVDEIIDCFDCGKWLKLRLAYGAGIWYVLAADWALTEPPRAEGGGDGAKTQLPQQDATAGLKRPVPYFSQKDNYVEANRTCFSSVGAMLLKYYMPDVIDGDDDYLRTVKKYGDTTEAATQMKALRSYGLKPVFAKNWTLDKLKETVCRKPVGIGLLHRSNYLSPAGGHWVLCHDYDYKTERFLIHDPWESDFDWRNGLYCSNEAGKNQLWVEDCLKYRWTVEAKDGHLHSGFALWID